MAPWKDCNLNDINQRNSFVSENMVRKATHVIILEVRVSRDYSKAARNISRSKNPHKNV